MKQKTFVVLGAFRGGTSVVAGLLRIFGIFMGERIAPLLGNNEDLDLQTNDIEKVKRIIRDRNEKYDVWGWKYPDSKEYIEKIIGEIRNPKLIIVFRDVYAIALSENKKMGWNIKGQLQRALRQQKKLVEIAMKYDCHLVSYEKMLIRKEYEVERLAEFCGIELKVEIEQRAIGFIRPEGWSSLRKREIL